MPPGTRAVLFDLDGTLVDTLDDIAAAVNASLRRLGLPPRTRDEVRGFVGEGARRLVERALGGGQESCVDAALAGFRDEYQVRELDRTRPYHGIPELLAELSARGTVASVLSNKPDAATRRLVAALFPPGAFRVVCGERPGVPLKPDPAAALAIARAVGVPPGETIFVGDSGVDMKTASAAGMVGAGAAWGYRSREELGAAGAAVILEKPADLLAALL